MGNCLKSVSTDDISLLRENQSARESSSDQLGPPPPYQVICLFLFFIKAIIKLSQVEFYFLFN